MREMVVLMPRADLLLKAGNRADNLAIFEPLLTELLPAFEGRYRVERTPDRRAIAGVSLGGELSMSLRKTATAETAPQAGWERATLLVVPAAQICRPGFDEELRFHLERACFARSFLKSHAAVVRIPPSPP